MATQPPHRGTWHQTHPLVGGDTHPNTEIGTEFVQRLERHEQALPSACYLNYGLPF
jgi:hypothetical protein